MEFEECKFVVGFGEINSPLNTILQNCIVYIVYVYIDVILSTSPHIAHETGEKDV